MKIYRAAETVTVELTMKTENLYLYLILICTLKENFCKIIFQNKFLSNKNTFVNILR